MVGRLSTIGRSKKSLFVKLGEALEDASSLFAYESVALLDLFQDEKPRIIKKIRYFVAVEKEVVTHMGYGLPIFIISQLQNIVTPRRKRFFR